MLTERPLIVTRSGASAMGGGCGGGQVLTSLHIAPPNVAIRVGEVATVIPSTWLQF